MRTHITITSALAGLFIAVLPAVAGTIFVSPIGSNAGGCGAVASPCQTLQKAHDRADAGGTILLTEPGSYGPATIEKSVSIRGVPGAGIFSPPTVPCLIFSGNATDVLTVDGLACDMDGVSKDGILINSGHKLRLNNTVVRGATGAKCGVRAKPSTGTFEVMINNSTLTENGTTGSNDGGGICILPTGPALVTGVIRNTQLQNNRHGFVSSAAGSTNSSFLIDGSDFSANAGGVFSVGANSTVCIRNSTISGNSFMGVGGAGARLDGGGNTVWNNIADGTFSGNCP
jgi:hypothetical protein